MQNQQKLISERDCAQYIGMSRAFLRKSRMDGSRQGHTPAPPWLRIGRTIRYDLEDIHKWIESRKVQPKTAPQVA